MPESPSILVFAQDLGIRQTLLCLVRGLNLETGRDRNAVSAILLGCNDRMAKGDLEAAAAAAHSSGAPIILVTSHGSEQLAVQALRAGISNYLRLPLKEGDLADALAAATPRVGAVANGDKMIGNSPALREVRRYLLRAAAFSSNVLITGETGTGKEVAAGFVHCNSSRAVKPLVTINCAAIPDSLLESELFGYERGAFTGANLAQDGKLKAAHGGTLFLDEIGDLSCSAQAKLLRLIETGEMQRLGGNRTQKIDVRIVAATHRNLESESGFRQDLYFRLNVARVHLPPLRERWEDILPLAEYFRANLDTKFGCSTKGFAETAKAALRAYRWPGNVRELRNIVEASFIDPGPDSNGLLELPPQFQQNALGTDSEFDRIVSALSNTQWNRSRAAEELQWSRMTLYRKMSQYNITRASKSGL